MPIVQAPTPCEPGRAARPRIPLHAPALSGREWAYVKECLDSGWVSSAGPMVGRFEQMVAAWLGRRHAVATSSGTTALHLALLAAGVEPDDEVLVPSLTFVATANAVRYCGAWPVFVDADAATWQMAPQRLSEFVTTRCQVRQGALRNRRSGRRVRAILPVHLLGHPCDMDAIGEIARRHALWVVEDAAQSLGAVCRGRKAGTFGDLACLSFNGNKVITTGGGGMVVTDDLALAERVRYLSTQAKDHPMEYIHASIGYNYRLSSLQAALGCGQLEQLDGHLQRKARMAVRYREAFADRPNVAPMPSASWASPAWWLFTLRLAPGRDAGDLVTRVAARGIEARRLWRPLPRLPMYRAAEQLGGEVADALYAQAFSLPSSPALSSDDQETVIEVVRELLSS